MSLTLRFRGGLILSCSVSNEPDFYFEQMPPVSRAEMSCFVVLTDGLDSHGTHLRFCELINFGDDKMQGYRTPEYYTPIASFHSEGKVQW